MPGHRPWPRYEVDHTLWVTIGQALADGSGDLIGLWADKDAVHIAIRAAPPKSACVISTAVAKRRIPVDRHGSIRRPSGSSARSAISTALRRSPRRTSGHGSITAPGGCARRSAPRFPTQLRDPAAYEFLPVHGEGLHQIPVGPVHAGIIEPGHFRFTANGETVARLEERLGYVHKGIDGLMTDVEIEQAARVVARVSGDSTVAYSFAFARAVEAALDVEPPPRAQMLRGVMAELERVANHFGDIGAICNDASFALIHAYCGIFRERVLAAADRAFGHRLMMDRIVPGGVEDMSPGGARGILLMIEEIEPQFAEMVRLYDDTPSLQDRTCTTGIVGPDLVDAMGRRRSCRPRLRPRLRCAARSSLCALRTATFDVPVLPEGDVNARVWVRIREIEQSLRLLKAGSPTCRPGRSAHRCRPSKRRARASR